MVRFWRHRFSSSSAIRFHLGFTISSMHVLQFWFTRPFCEHLGFRAIPPLAEGTVNLYSHVRTGRCANKDEGSCPLVHDPDKVAVCGAWIEGRCTVPDCPLQHRHRPQLMPLCEHFLKAGFQSLAPWNYWSLYQNFGLWMQHVTAIGKDTSISMLLSLAQDISSHKNAYPGRAIINDLQLSPFFHLNSRVLSEAAL